jgi:hypothetical protein
MNLGLLCLVGWVVLGIVGWSWLAWSAAHAPYEPPGQHWD